MAVHLSRRAPVYWVSGPVRAQDGRQVWQVVRDLTCACCMPSVFGEALTREHAQAQADELNTVLEEIEHGLQASTP